MSKFELPDFIYRYVSGEEDVNQEITTAQENCIPEDFIFEKGVFIKWKGAYHLQKVIAMPHVLYAFNLAKRHIIEPLKFLNKWYFYPGLLIALRKPETFIESFNMMTWRFIKPYLLKEEYMTPQSKEIEWFIYMFLKNIGFQDYNSEQFSATIAHCIEYDSAYRYIVVDLLNITNKELLICNPRKEIYRVLSHFIDRNSVDLMSKKFKAVLKLIKLILMIPKYKKAFIETLKTVNFKNFELDEIDTYWMCLRNDGYNYLGLTDKERNRYRRSKKMRRPLLIKK